MKGLAPKTLKVFDKLADLNFLNEFLLVGGTGIALQINHRLSEDLDFCKWVPKSNVKNAISVKKIENDLKGRFDKVSTNHLSFDQVDFRVNEVKLTFFNEVGLNLPLLTPITILGNIKGVPLSLHGSMKTKTLFERITFRDYYDLYVLLRDKHISMDELIYNSIQYQPKLKKEMIIKRLIKWELIKEEVGFWHLSPKYSVSIKEIGHYFWEVTKPYQK